MGGKTGSGSEIRAMEDRNLHVLAVGRVNGVGRGGRVSVFGREHDPSFQAGAKGAHLPALGQYDRARWDKLVQWM